MNNNRRSDKSFKIFKIFIWVPLILSGLFLIMVGFYGFYFFIHDNSINKGEDISLIVSSLALVSGISLLVISWRIITDNYRKKDGGLFPPIILYIFGIVFSVGPIINILQKSYLVILDILYFSIPGACFGLAKKRKKIIANRNKNDN